VITKVLPELAFDERLQHAVSQMTSGEVNQGLSIHEMVSELFEGTQQIISKEKGKFEEITLDKKVDLEFRVGKGAFWGMWGMNAGVCIGSDVELWKKKDFFLLGMIDKTTGQAVGFIHLFEAVVDGQRVLTIPGIEPSTEFLGAVRPEAVWPLIEKALTVLGEAAVKAGYKALYIPSDKVILSNRTDIYDIVRKKGYRQRKLTQKVEWSTKPAYPFENVYEFPIPSLPAHVSPPMADGTAKTSVDAAQVTPGGIDLSSSASFLKVVGDDDMKASYDADLVRRYGNCVGFIPVITGITPAQRGVWH
jgi:hypothetical protein